MITFTQLEKMGRLGNQLFQISATMSLALKNNDSYGFYNWSYKNLFNLDFCFFETIEPKMTYKENGFHYTPIPYKQDMDLVGYFQSEKYFREHKNLIIETLTPRYESDPEDGLCGIHVRRGDYLNLKDYHYNLNLDYYHRAMSEVNAKKYIIFSDDIKWCKSNFIGKQFIFSEGKKEHEDLAIMAKKCEHMIIANSSFSWWGAYLNKNQNKIVIAPKTWFGPELKGHDTKDLLPENWIKI